jgi:hypothetical protein
VAERVHPGVDRHRSLRHAEAAEPVGDEDERSSELRARKRIFLAFERGDEQLVGLAARERAEKDEAVALGDDADPLLALFGEHPA